MNENQKTTLSFGARSRATKTSKTAFATAAVLGPLKN